MSVITASDVEQHDVHGARFFSFVRPAVGSGALCVWRLELDPGTAGVEHRPSHEEALVVVEGTLQISIDGAPALVQPGEVVLVPAGAAFSVGTGDDSAVAWVSTTAGLTATMADGTALAPPWAN